MGFRCQINGKTQRVGKQKDIKSRLKKAKMWEKGVDRESSLRAKEKIRVGMRDGRAIPAGGSR